MYDPDVTGTALLHAGKRRWLVIVGGNALLLVVMLGLPWLRGYLRTRALWDAFGRYGACLYAGERLPEPGLGMPRGHEAHFATRALRTPGFAATCDDALSALAPDDVIFLMPGVKVAERDLRAAVALLRDELAPLASRAPGTRLSVRPLRALERLRAGLANHALATGLVEVPQEEAFRLPARPVIPAPTRLPLAAGADAQLALWGSDAELHALATDRAGISYAHLRAGKLAQGRVARPGLLEAAIPHGEPSTFVWAMARARCAERAGGCATKTFGVASVRLPLGELPAPRWLGAHPSGRSDRSVVRAGGLLTVAAARADGTSEVRRFALSLDERPSPDMPPLKAESVYAGSAAGEPLALAPESGPRVLTAASAEGELALSELAPEGPRVLAKLAGTGVPWVVGCAESTRVGLAYGHATALVVAELEGAELRAHAQVTLALRDVVDPRDAARDRAVRVCGFDDRAVLVALDARAQLWLVQCKDGEAACRTVTIARGVRRFAALGAGARLIVGYVGDAESSQVRVRSVLLDAPERAEEQVPAVCWSDGRGLCGTPVLARLGQRVLLGTREGGDLMLLESDVLGVRWSPLEGLSRYH